jgi:16S rRNA (guanine(527)-N(7))-methyltransferase RsmG
VPGGIVEHELRAAGLSVSSKAHATLETYLQELQRWNKTVNLTSLDGGELVRRLVVEPIWLGQQLQLSGRLADIGSGNGSPGIPLYVGCSLTRVHLVESRARRAAFLRHVAHLLDRERILVHKARVEQLEQIERVEWITLQAVRPSELLLQALQRLFEPTTRVVWITASQEPPISGAFRVSMPHRRTEAWVFQLDQF